MTVTVKTNLVAILVSVAQRVVVVNRLSEQRYGKIDRSDL